MKKIVFVENRYFTWILDAVAHGLQTAGYEIHWIVQNPVFTPRHGLVHIIPFPASSALVQPDDTELHRRLFASDRGVRWFGGNGFHWAYYREQIQTLIGHLQPDFVFGETTQFHELLTCDICREHGIPFLSPNVTRYPVGRLNFFLYDSLDPVGGEASDLNDVELSEMLDAIVNRTVRPSYMEPVKDSPTQKLLRILSDKQRILSGWLKGERYVTPSPLTKIRLDRNHAKNFRVWESFAHRSLPEALSGKPCVLFPLQMQPESNIEVWGSPWSDQLDIAKRAASALEEVGAVLIVKPNPKSKYELNAALCELVANTPNILAISHLTPMKDIFRDATLVLTVTGTVLMECVFSGKPVASLGTHAMTRYPGVVGLDSPEKIASVLLKVCQGKLAGASREQAKSLLNTLYKTSYPAMTWDPLSQAHLLSDWSTLDSLCNAFKHVLGLEHSSGLRIFDFLDNGKCVRESESLENTI
jgi:hypothetical protein